MNIIFITTNANKVKEAKEVLKDFDILQVDKEYPEIQSASSEDVVLYALEHLREKEPFMIEDTSLYIQSLNGFPGPFASYAQKTIGNNGILRLMEGLNDRRAFFETCVGLRFNGTTIFKGRCNGHIALRPQGKSGFGFDPVFVPEGSGKTFAEMSVEEKNSVSHRSKAFMALKEHLETFK